MPIFRFCLTAMAAAGLAACSSSSAGPGELPPRPANVAEDTHRTCHQEGVRAGAAAVSDIADGAQVFAMLTGGLGAIVALSAAEAAKSGAYSSAYDECVARAAKTEEKADKPPEEKGEGS